MSLRKGFAYHAPNPFAYQVLDPAKYKFTNSALFRPPTPPQYTIPEDPFAPPKKEEKKESESAADGGGEGGDKGASEGTEGDAAEPAPAGEDCKSCYRVKAMGGITEPLSSGRDEGRRGSRGWSREGGENRSSSRREGGRRR